MAKVFSKTLGKEYDLVVFKKVNKDGSIAKVISSTSLQDMYNEMKPRPRCVFAGVPNSGVNYSVVECTIEYEGEVFSETGTAAPKTLNTEIAKLCPYTTARQRAFDKTFKAFCRFDMDSISDDEIESYDDKKEEVKNEAEKAAETTPSSLSEDELGSIKVTFGKGKGKTIAELWQAQCREEKPDNWFDYIIGMIKDGANYPVVKKMIEYKNIQLSKGK